MPAQLPAAMPLGHSKSDETATFKFVGFCDVLGFSAAIAADFDATVTLYQEFRQHLARWPLPQNARVSVYSDSILIVADELPALINAIVKLNWISLLEGWLIRGGVAQGKHWEASDDRNLFVVSEALVKAVALEKAVKVPAVVVSEEIHLGIEAWVPRFEHGVFRAPLLHFDGRSLVNPFNEYWFASAAIRVRRLLKDHPAHHEKYNWFLSLVEAVARDDTLVPEAALERMLELGVLQRRSEL